MRKMFLVVLACLSAGCYQVTLSGPGGVQTIVPLKGTMIVRVYNHCAHLLVAEGFDHRVEIPYGNSVELVLPNLTFGDEYEQKTVVFTTFNSAGKETGTMMDYFSPNGNDAVTRQQYIVGGQYRHIYDNAGHDACMQ